MISTKTMIKDDFANGGSLEYSEENCTIETPREKGELFLLLILLFEVPQGSSVFMVTSEQHRESEVLDTTEAHAGRSYFRLFFPGPLIRAV